MYPERVRSLTLILIGATLGFGGVAIAQPDLVVDPWGRASAEPNSWFEPVTARPEERPIDTELRDPWGPRGEMKASPVVVPLAPFGPRAVERTTTPPVRHAEPLVIDPWSPVVASEIPSLGEPKAQATNARPRLVPWSDRVVEIVDPWKRMPDFASDERIRLVVDPWAR